MEYVLLGLNIDFFVGIPYYMVYLSTLGLLWGPVVRYNVLQRACPVFV
jgi:hypothetical protein